MTDLIDHKVRAFLDIEENGPYTAPDGSVMRIDPPLPFDINKPLLLDGDEPISLTQLLCHSGRPVVIEDKANNLGVCVFLRTDNRSWTWAAESIHRISNAPEFEFNLCRAYDVNGHLVDTFHSDYLPKWLASHSDDDYMVQHWTRRPGEKFATPELVWPKEENEQ